MTIAQPLSAKKQQHPLARTQPSSAHIPKINPVTKIPSSFSSSAALNKAKSSNFRLDSKLQNQHKHSLRSAVPQEALIDIDEIDDIMEHMYNIEASTMPNVELIDLQPELRWHMRPYLIDFLVEVHHQSRLRPETLYLAVNIVDRYVSRRIVYKKHYQLVGCAALWIAAKYEDAKDRVPTVEDLTRMCCGAYEESAFVQMERHVLDTLSWTLGHPTADAWLRLYCQGPWCGRRRHLQHRASSTPEESAVQHLARFLLELTLFSRSFVAQRPSMLAKAALLLARFIHSRPRRIFDEDQQSLRIAAALDSSLARHLGQGPPVSSIVANKYSHSCFSRASLVATRFYQQGGRFSWYPIDEQGAALTNGSASVSSIASAGSASSTTYNTSSASSAETSFTSFDMCSSPSSASSVSSHSCQHHAKAEDDADCCNDIEMESDNDDVDDEKTMPDTPESSGLDHHQATSSSSHLVSSTSAVHANGEKNNRQVLPAAVASNSVPNFCLAHQDAQRQAYAEVYTTAREATIPRCYSSGTTNIKVKVGDVSKNNIGNNNNEQPKRSALSASTDRFLGRYHPHQQVQAATASTKYNPLSKSTTAGWEVNVVSQAMISTYNK